MKEKDMGVAYAMMKKCVAQKKQLHIEHGESRGCRAKAIPTCRHKDAVLNFS